MERVLWPMEPVEPRIASFFTRLIFSECRGLVLGYRLARDPPGVHFRAKSSFQMDYLLTCLSVKLVKSFISMS
jgi:hypothetical protein